MLPTAATVVTIGRKYSVRQKPWKRSRLIALASTTEATNVKTTEPAAKTSVLTRMGATNVDAGLRISAKLSSPTNSIWVRSKPPQAERASTTAKIRGRIRKIAKKRRLGERNA